jgi:hypothetical protein
MRAGIPILLGLCAIAACAPIAGLDDLRLCVEGCDDVTPDGSPVACNADVKTDPESCGYCGHSCMGGECQNGACKPVQVVTADMSGVLQLGAEGNDLFWRLDVTTDAGSPRPMLTCPAVGCTAPRRLFENDRIVDRFALSSTGVYASAHGLNLAEAGAEIIRCVPTSCGQGTRITALEHANAMTLEGNELYWIDDYTYEVRRCQADNCAATSSILATGQQAAQRIVASGQRLFWTTNLGTQAKAEPSKLHVLTIGEGVPRTFEPLVEVSSIAIRGEHLFYSGANALMRLEGSTAKKVGGDARPGSIATDETHVYWTGDGTGSIFRCPLHGCVREPEVVVASQPDIKGLIIHQGMVYFTRPDGIFRVARP